MAGRKKEERNLNVSWSALEGKIAPEVFHAPKTGGDPHGQWPAVHERIVAYLLRNVVGAPWANHLALIAAVLSARRRDVQTVEVIVQTLHARLSLLFQAFGLKHVEEWNADLHAPAYLKAEVLPEESQYMRMSFFRRYTTATKHVWNWLDALPIEMQQAYQPFVLPMVNPLHVEGLVKWEELEQQQHQTRKAETEAVVPQFAALRAEAHFRYNRLVRLRQAYRAALQEYRKEPHPLPYLFSYEEGEPAHERLHFRLWDRRSFVLAHAEQYSQTTCYDAIKGRDSFSDDRNSLFLEFVKAERLVGDVPPEGLWFAELLKARVLGHAPRKGSEEDMATRQAWLRAWGYGGDGSHGPTAPFFSHISGLLSWANGNTNEGGFMSDAQTRAEGVLVPVDSLYAAATFGLLALDILTSTGMRIGELMQISVSRDCIIRLVDDPPPGATDQSPRIRYLVRLLPKGERTATLQSYGIGKETVRLMEKTCQLLCEHYALQAGKTLPRVAFAPTNRRSHRFGAEPYLFQYAHKHLNAQTITACMRFLIHGMVFQTSEGKPVIIKPHLLRHAFATYAVQVEKLPVDLVAEWLKQKNLDVTNYYSQMPAYMQAEEHLSFLSRMAMHINIREAILRSPEEIQKQAEEARKRVGTLVPVAGGECTLDVYCPNQFDCIHCPAKAPDPAKRYQVEEKRHWAEERRQYYEQEGLILEAEKMKQLIRACELELKEMDMILAYRKDESRAAFIQIQPRKRPQ
jgi:hypothetical protein